MEVTRDESVKCLSTKINGEIMQIKSLTEAINHWIYGMDYDRETKSESLSAPISSYIGMLNTQLESLMEIRIELSRIADGIEIDTPVYQDTEPSRRF